MTLFQRYFLPFFAFLILFSCSIAFAQTSNFDDADKEQALHYLASDELMGRRTGSPGIFAAGNFIAEKFKEFGCSPLMPADSWFQHITFLASQPGKEGQLILGDRKYSNHDDLLFLSGPEKQLKGDAIFVKHGWVDESTGHNDYEGKDLKGKVVFCLAGTPDSKDPLVVMNAMAQKQIWAAERGAVAIFEIYQLPFPWNFFKNYFSGETTRPKSPGTPDLEKQIPYGWLRDVRDDDLDKIIAGNFSVEGWYSGTSIRPFTCRNVLAMVPGTDPVYKNEFVIVTAHYDHVGTGAKGGSAYSEQDSIFNGARDNATGTVALLSAAHSLAKNPAKRSVIFVAFTAEEMGLLGSAFFVENPPIPLSNMIFNLNGDGAGYDDIGAISVIGYGRTGTDYLIDSIASILNLRVIPNPAPNQNLYDRSDNVSFASKGIPAINISPGITGFTPEILKHYHQVSDESDSLDFQYLAKYWEAFTHATRAVANMHGKPFWKSGDKYEPQGKLLYDLND